MTTKILCAALGGLVGIATLGPAATFHVSPHGSDTAAGTAAAPWQTIGRAAAVLAPGDTCVVHAGTYRETLRLTRSGTAEARIVFAAADDGDVILNGTDPVADAWEIYRGEIRSVPMAGPVLQVFVGEEQQTWARWPNRNPHDRWDRQTWEPTGAGSRYGLVVDPGLAQAKIDWTGATAVLNVAHQFLTWTRPVQTFDALRGSFTYTRDLAPTTNYADKTAEWEDDRYYLAGKLEALDAPGEWFFDAGASRLYFWPPEGSAASLRAVAIKRRPLGLQIEGAHHVSVRGFRFVGCTLQVHGDDNEIADCELQYPVHAFHMSEPGADASDDATEIIGNRNAVQRCTVAGANTIALAVRGERNLVEDCVLHDACWDGSLAYPIIALDHPDDDKTQGNTLRYCTIFDGGNTLVRHAGPGNVIELCHIHDGGRVAKDVALVQGGSPRLAGSVVRYNWVHGCRPYVFEGGLTGGLGIRGDDQTRGFIVHHNVVWDCDRDGIIVKGDFDEVSHNTVFGVGTEHFGGNGLSLHREAEPHKPWQNSKTPLLPVQNQHTHAANNAVTTLTCDRVGTPFPAQASVERNYIAPDLVSGPNAQLVDPAHFDFRPRPGSALIDAGTPIAGVTGATVGAAPDIGAYEAGGEDWVPGARIVPARLRTRIERNRRENARADREWTRRLGDAVVARTDIPYIPDVGDKGAQTLDVFSPRNAAGPRPVIVFVHGGGMSAGDKRPAVLVENKARHFPAEGYVFVSVNYRLAPEVRYPAQLRGVIAAVAFARVHAAEWGGDPDKMFLIGHSAGAQLVAEAITSPAVQAEFGLPSAAIRGAVLLDSALYDLPFAVNHPRSERLVRDIVQMTYGFSPARWAAASPINRLPAVPVLPPLLVFHANDTGSLSRDAAERFATRWREQGGRASLEAAREKDHAHLGRDLGTPGDWITGAVLAFLHASLDSTDSVTVPLAMPAPLPINGNSAATMPIVHPSRERAESAGHAIPPTT